MNRESGEAENPVEDVPYQDQVESFGGGHIESRHGGVDGWLSVVYLILFIWAIYYGFTEWRGLGPGLDY